VPNDRGQARVELRQQILKLDGVQALEWLPQDSIEVFKDQVRHGFIRREPSTVMLDRRYVVFAVFVARLQMEELGVRITFFQESNP
jgi:hypothetical protein